MDTAIYNLKLKDFQPRNDTVFGLLPSLYSIGRTPFQKRKQWNKLPKTRSPQHCKADFIKYLKEEARKIASQQEYAATMGVKWVPQPITQVFKKAVFKHVNTPVKKVALKPTTAGIELSIPLRFNTTKPNTTIFKDTSVRSLRKPATSSSSPSIPNANTSRVQKPITERGSSKTSKIRPKEVNDLLVDQLNSGEKNEEEKEQARKAEKERAREQNQKHYADLSDGEESDDDGSFNPSLAQAVKGRRRN